MEKYKDYKEDGLTMGKTIQERISDKHLSKVDMEKYKGQFTQILPQKTYLKYNKKGLRIG